MKLVTTKDTLEKEWADRVYSEIRADDENSWFWPKSKDHEIFEQAYMKFMNRNLNYFYFGNMVAAVLEGDKLNPNLSETIKFCNYVRTLTGDIGPFGRMCVWRLPPKTKLLNHVDNFRYHRQIVRNIFVINKADSEIRIDDVLVEHEEGTLFQFYPAVEYHTFENKSDYDFYFLGFDFWKPELLKQSITSIMPALSGIMSDQYRLTKFGAVGTNAKYMSAH
jgi:hypothetical protein